MRSILTLAVALWLSGFASAGDAGAPDWLEGTWQRETRRGIAYERWTAVTPRTLEGQGWMVAPDGKRVPTESLLLAEMGGTWFLIPRPKGNPLPVAFVRVEAGPRRIVFENRDHDFPQRIGYESPGDGSLLAWIEGPDDGETRRVEFAFERAPTADADVADDDRGD